jgi:hypothetical protein
MPGTLKVVRFAEDDIYYSPAPSTPSPAYSFSSLPSSTGPLTPPPLHHHYAPLPPVKDSPEYPSHYPPHPVKDAAAYSSFSPYSPHLALGPVRIHPALGFQSNPSFFWDVARHPSTSRTPLSSVVLAAPATNPPLPTLTIISPYFPWSITITSSSPSHSPGVPAFVTVADVLSTLHHTLRLPVRQAEYDKLPTMEAKHCVNNAYQARCRGSEEEARKGVRRVDFLGGRRTFLGLSSSRAGPSVWVLNVT